MAEAALPRSFSLGRGLHALGALAMGTLVFCLGCPSGEDGSTDATFGRDASHKDGGAVVDSGGADLADIGHADHPVLLDVGAVVDAAGPADSGTSPDTGGATVDASAAADSGPAVDAGEQTTLTDFWANTQWPPYLTLAQGTKASAYGQIWIKGGTDKAGAMPGLVAELGIGALGSDPGSWTWSATTFNGDKQSGSNDEFAGEITAPASGVWEYAFRYRVAGATFQGVGEWLYAGTKGPTLKADEAGKLTVKIAGGRVRIATQNLHCQNDDPKARFAAMAARWAALQVDVVALEEICDDSSTGVGNSADYLAKALAAATGRPFKFIWVQTHLANNVTPEGVGIVSALPLAATGSIDLVTADFPRKALLGVYATQAGMLAVITSHLSYRQQDDAARLQQAQQILAMADDWQAGAARPAGTHALVAGDFNTAPDTAPIKALTGAASPFTDDWAAKNQGAPGYSYPSGAPTTRIDYLLSRAAPATTLDVVDASEEFLQPYTGTSYVSDHAGFVATLGVP